MMRPVVELVWSQVKISYSSYFYFKVSYTACGIKSKKLYCKI